MIVELSQSSGAPEMNSKLVHISFSKWFDKVSECGRYESGADTILLIDGDSHIG